MAPVLDKVKAIAVMALATGALAALDALSAADLGFLGDWKVAATAAVATAVAWIKRETKLADYAAKS